MHTLRHSTSLFALTLLLAACGSPDPTAPAADNLTDPNAANDFAAPALATEAPAEVVEAPTEAAPMAEGMSGEDFVAQLKSLSGTTVTVATCSLDTTVSSTGQMACRVQDADGNDVKDAGGLPVDIFFDAMGLSDDAKAYIVADCADNYCTTQITGALTVAEGTDFAEMTEVVLGPATR